MKKVLDFIKSNTIALACGVVALLAMVAYFIYPIPTMFGALQKEVDERKPIHDALASLKDSPRTLPQLQADSTAAKPLELFPTDKVIKAGEDALQRLSDQSDQVLKALVKVNQRPLLVPNSLPNPTALARQNFLDAYKAITQQYGEAAKQGLIATKLKGSLPPTAEEMRDIEAAVVNQIMKTDLQINGQGQPVNQAEVDQKINEVRAKLPLEQRVLRALNSQIYVSPGAVPVIQELLQTTNQPDTVTIFNAQFSLWVQSAVFEAIAAANAGSENVLTSPVKHLVQLDMNMAFVTSSGSTGSPTFSPGAPTDAPPPVEMKPDASAPITRAYTNNPLGYTSNNMFDPIPVALTLRIDGRKLPAVLASLQGGQLLKIKNVNFRSVDMGRALQEGFVYDKDGKTPMVEVNLDCDVLMLRSWLVMYMPDPVKQHFAALSNPVPTP